MKREPSCLDEEWREISEMDKKEELAKIVGNERVTVNTSSLEEYSRDESFIQPIRPVCIVKPENANELRLIVKWANETLTPLVTVSSGAPHFRGDSVPGTSGAVMVDLSGMKKILRIDRRNRVAMIEPGVTFGELSTELGKTGLRLNMPLLPRRRKSVVGSVLEREPVVMPKYHWDIADPLNCVEIIFGTGDMFRTGAAAGPGGLEEQWAAGGAQVEAAGPSTASWYRVIQGSQGTMGIVTWASTRCELLPKLEEPFVVGSPDLDKIMELVHWLIRLRIPNECLILNNSNLAAIMARKWPADYKAIKDSLPPYILLFSIAGYDYLPEERVSTHVDDMKGVAQRTGMEPSGAIGRITASDLLKAVNQPSGEPYWKLHYRGACQDIFFLTIYDKLQELVNVMYDAANKAGYPATDIGVYLQPIVQGANCHCEFILVDNHAADFTIRP